MTVPGRPTLATPPLVRGRLGDFPIYVLLAILAVFYLATLRSGHDWGDDFAQYVAHARNIASGRDYADTGYLYNPRFPILGPRTYPPVFPLLLAPVIRVFGVDLTAMKVEIVVFFLASLWLLARLTRPRLSRFGTVGVLCVVGFNPLFWNLKDHVLSDLPWLFFIHLALLIALNESLGAGECSAGTARGISLGTPIALAFGARSLGGVLLPAIYAADLLRHRRVTRTTWIATATFVGISLPLLVLTRGDTSYSNIVSFNPHALRGNLNAYAHQFIDFWDNGGGAASKGVVAGLFLLLALSTFGRRFARGATVLEVFYALYSIALLPWVAVQGRYLIPVLIACVLYAFEGVEHLARRAPIAVQKGALFALIVVAVAGYAARYARTDFGPLRTGVGTRESQELWREVRRDTDVGDVFVFQKPRALALFTGRRAAALHAPTGDPDVADYLRSVGAHYVILGPDSPTFLYQPALRSYVERHSNCFDRVYANSDFTMYRILTDCGGHGGTGVGF